MAIEQFNPNIKSPGIKYNPQGAYAKGSIGEQADWAAVYDAINKSMTGMMSAIGQTVAIDQQLLKTITEKGENFQQGVSNLQESGNSVLSTTADNIIKEVIRSYTKESGVRNLEREIGKVCRKVVTKLVRTGKDRKITVTSKLVKELLGVPVHQRDYKADQNEVGIAMGLGVTQMGGELMLIEAVLMPGSGKTVLTGKLGEVMQESAKAAFSFVRSNTQLLGIDEDDFAKSDLHIHIPDGAIPKDGPSAGLPLMIAIISAFTKNPVKNEVAMTGEITLRGQITEIGGLKEKLLAARRGLLTKVLIPEDNKKDLDEIPIDIMEGLKVIPLNKIQDALEHALENFPLIEKALPEQPLVISENLSPETNPQTPVA